MADAMAPRRVDPLEVLTVEHEAAMYQEQRAAEAKVVGEITPRPDPDCTHDRLSALRSAGSSFDDMATHWGFCPDCNDYFVVTEYSNGTLESRPMTEAEQLRFAAAEDRRSRNEWLTDLDGASL